MFVIHFIHKRIQSNYSHVPVPDGAHLDSNFVQAEIIFLNPVQPGMDDHFSTH